jgi:hypothetical protein
VSPILVSYVVFVINFHYFDHNKQSKLIILTMYNAISHGRIMYRCKVSVYYLDYIPYLNFYNHGFNPREGVSKLLVTTRGLQTNLIPSTKRIGKVVQSNAKLKGK